MKRALVCLGIAGLIAIVAIVRRDFQASFVMDLGSEIAPDSLPCSAPDTFIISHAVLTPRVWEQFVAPRFQNSAESEQIRQGCVIRADDLEVVDGRYRCEFVVSLAHGGAREFAAVVAGVGQYYAPRGFTLLNAPPWKPNHASETTRGK